MIYFLDTVALITALCVTPMMPNGNPNRIILVVCLVIGGFAFFGTLSRLGDKYLELTVNKSKRLSIPDSPQKDSSDMLEDENQRKLFLEARVANTV